ncbi:MAG: hypothetical protein WC254_05255 [Candidatus Woesearchaeota archaeon]|jgi:hypothetical protein
MNWKQLFTVKKMIFLLLFIAGSLIAARINFSTLVGSTNQTLTLFQFFGPIAGAFLGGIFGIVTVFTSQILNNFLLGKEWTLITVLRLLPMIFAVFYFAYFHNKSKYKTAVMIIVPILAIILFNLNEAGRGAWYYSLFWLIPIFAVVGEKLPGKLFFRSFGATFTAHAIGTIVWVYTVPMTVEQWTALVPVTAYERFAFSIGIAVSFVVVNTLLDVVCDKLEIQSETLKVEPGYILSKRMFSF